MAKSEVEKKNESLNKFKFEADMTVFGTKVELKPMENEDEIGYRAKEGEKGISITREKLQEAGFIEKDGAAYGLIPTETNIKTIVYNRKREKVEFAVEAEFTPGPLSKKQMEALKEKYKGDNAGLLADLKKKAEQRKIALTKKEDGKDVDKTAADLEQDLLAAPAGFILNKYPDIFTLDRVSIYIGPDTAEPEAEKVEAPKEEVKKEEEKKGEA